MIIKKDRVMINVCTDYYGTLYIFKKKLDISILATKIRNFLAIVVGRDDWTTIDIEQFIKENYSVKEIIDIDSLSKINL